MAWGRIFKERKYWYTDIIFQGQRKRKKIGTRKETAQTILDNKLAELILEEHGIIKNEQVTLKEFVPEYLIYKKNSTKANSYAGIELRVNLYLVPFFRKEFLSNISPHKVFSYQSKRLSGGVCNATIDREITCLNNLLYTAVE